MDKRIRYAIRNYLASGDPQTAEIALNMILRTGMFGEAAAQREPSEPWGTIPFDPDNPPRTARELYLTVPNKITIPDGKWKDVAFALKHVEAVYHDNRADEFAYLVHVHHYVDYTSRDSRSVDLAAIFFDGEPVLIFQTAGRDGRDHRARFVTHPENYRNLCHYLLDLPIMENDWEFRDEELVELDDIDDRLFQFYGVDARNMMND
jgi:hypothetical protein